MAGRPYWSGQVKISLVSFGVQLFPAVTTQKRITFHQIDRKTGQRIRHRNVAENDDPVEDVEIVKGYEYTKGKFLLFEPEELARLRIPTKNVIEIGQFVNLDEIQPALFEKPYFVAPEPKESFEAFVVMRKAMQDNRKAAIGEVAFGGREHLVAIAVPPDQSEMGLMAYMLRYSEELRDSKNYFDEAPAASSLHIDKKQLAMANDLIKAYSGPLDLNAFKDDYEAALRELIEAKQKNLPLPLEEKGARPPKVISLTEALRQSIGHAKRPAVSRKQATKSVPKKGPASVGGSSRAHKVA